MSNGGYKSPQLIMLLMRVRQWLSKVSAAKKRLIDWCYAVSERTTLHPPRAPASEVGSCCLFSCPISLICRVHVPRQADNARKQRSGNGSVLGQRPLNNGAQLLHGAALDRHRVHLVKFQYRSVACCSVAGGGVAHATKRAAQTLIIKHWGGEDLIL